MDPVHDRDILVPLDGSDRSREALRYAWRLLPAGGTIRLLTVIEPPDWFDRTFPGVKSADVLQNAESEAAAYRLNETADELRVAAGLGVSTLTVSGDPAQEILAAATDTAVSMIAMGSAGRGALERFQFGSVADRVSRSATVPVLVVRDGGTRPLSSAKIDRLVLPLDGSKRALRVLPTATRLAKQLGIPVLLVIAKDAESLMLAYGSSLNMAAYELIAEEIDKAAAASLDEPARELMAVGIAVERVVVAGPAAHAIAAVCGENDLIVMTSHGRGGVMRWLIGSVAEKLVRDAPVPVLLVPARD